VLQAINSEYDDKMIDAIASWAHKVHVKPSKSKQKERGDPGRHSRGQMDREAPEDECTQG
jgi:hypothetical protein